MNPAPPATAADLRRRAEAALSRRPPQGATPLSLIEAQGLVHELQLHQIELEMQNDELQRSCDVLATAAARYTDLYEFAPVGYVTLERGGAVVEANRAAAQLVGSEREWLAGRQLAAFIADGDRRAFTDCIGGAFVAEVRQTCEVALAESDGQHALHVEATASADGVSCHLMLHDVSARRRQEAQLHLLETCVAQLNDSVLITDASTAAPGPRIVFANRACERVTGYSRAELIGQRPRLFQGPDTDRAELARIGAALHRREPVRAELLNFAKDGSAYWIELNITPVLSASGELTHFVSVQRDITERRAVQAQLAGQVQALQVRNDELDRFNRAMIDRELRMLELKAQVNALHARLGVPPRYTMHDAGPGPGPGLTAATLPANPRP